MKLDCAFAAFQAARHCAPIRREPSRGVAVGLSQPARAQHADLSLPRRQWRIHPRLSRNRTAKFDRRAAGSRACCRRDNQREQSVILGTYDALDHECDGQRRPPVVHPSIWGEGPLGICAIYSLYQGTRRLWLDMKKAAGLSQGMKVVGLGPAKAPRN